jgi:hypothetical protein
VGVVRIRTWNVIHIKLRILDDSTDTVFWLEGPFRLDVDKDSVAADRRGVADRRHVQPMRVQIGRVGSVQMVHAALDSVRLEFQFVD